MGKHLELMAEYNGHMLWRQDPPSVGSIDPEELPLTRETVMLLKKWEEIYDNRLNWDDPANTPDWNPDELNEFENEGVRLWLRLREELYPEYEVSYFSERLQRHLRDPKELTK